MAKKKAQAKPTLRDCSKCINVKAVNEEYHCKLSMMDCSTPNSLSKVTFKDCSSYKEKRI